VAKQNFCHDSLLTSVLGLSTNVYLCSENTRLQVAVYATSPDWRVSDFLNYFKKSGLSPDSIRVRTVAVTNLFKMLQRLPVRRFAQRLLDFSNDFKKSNKPV